MEQNSNYITVEVNFKLSMKDYRLVLGLKKTWVLMLIVCIARFIEWYWGNQL